MKVYKVLSHEGFRNEFTTWKDEEGRNHYEDGPARIWKNGQREWWFNGKRHREDGPAIIDEYGVREWYLDGKIYHESEYHEEMFKRNLSILNEGY